MGKFSHIDGQIKIVTQKLPQKMCSCGCGFRVLLKQEIHWHWEEQQEKALNEIKKVLTSKPVLSYYVVNKPVKLQHIST